MRIRWMTCPRIPRVPLAVVAAFSCWGLYVLGGVALEWYLGRSIETCIFHATTGLPCPGCGGTRAVLSLAHGHWLEALRFNPMVASGVLGICAVLLLRVVAGRYPKVACGRIEGIVLVVLLFAGVLANWIWLVRVLP